MIAPVAPAHADGAEPDRGTPGMHPRLLRLKQPKPVWLQFVHDRRTAPETSYTSQGPSGSYLSTRRNMIAPTEPIANE